MHGGWLVTGLYPQARLLVRLENAPFTAAPSITGRCITLSTRSIAISEHWHTLATVKVCRIAAQCCVPEII